MNYGDGTLNIVDDGSLTVRQTGNPPLDWSFIGQGTGKSTLNLSGNASLTFGVPGSTHHVLFYWGNTVCGDSGTGEAEINVSDNATLFVENSIWLWQGRSRTHITGGSITAGDLEFNEDQVSPCVNADNVITISGAGKLRVRQSNYPSAQALAHIADSRITGSNLTVTSVSLDGTIYTQISVTP